MEKPCTRPAASRSVPQRPANGPATANYGCRAPGIERFVGKPARSALSSDASVHCPTSRNELPYPASPLSASGTTQRKLVMNWVGTRNASAQSTLNTLNSGVLYPPICAAHVLADRSRHRLPSKPHLATQSRRRHRKTRDRQRKAKSSANSGVGTIDDKTGNYRRALGTIDDRKKPHKTQEKTTPK